MRLKIISGKFGGRFLDSPDTTATHPMSERIRGSLFNILGSVENLTVLDAFAGSGALGFEALSRGAKSVLAVEKNRLAQKIILQNAVALNLNQPEFKLVKANVRSWAESVTEQKFDLILCDPPYHDLQLSTVALLTEHLNEKGLMILSHSGRESVPTVKGVVVVDARNYGDAALAFYRH